MTKSKAQELQNLREQHSDAIADEISRTEEAKQRTIDVETQLDKAKARVDELQAKVDAVSQSTNTQLL